jgi:outer membrane protein
MMPSPLHYAVIAVLFAILPTLADAETSASEQPSAAQALASSVFGQHTDLTVGAAVTYAARYPGADRWQLVPAPILSIQRGMLFADTLRGIGLQYQSSSEFYVSQSVYYDFGRLDKDNRWRPGSSRLAGMGDTPGSTTARTLVAQPLTEWMLVSAETEMAVRDTARRNRYRVGLELSALKTDADNVTIDLDGWWGDARYNLAYFGVTAQQAARTRFAAFHPGAGLYAQAPSVSWEHHLDKHWSSTLQLTDTRYAGRVGGSPIVAQRMSASASAALAYAY